MSVRILQFGSEVHSCLGSFAQARLGLSPSGSLISPKHLSSRKGPFWGPSFSPRYGTGYCDAQCPHDIKFIGGKANSEGWRPNERPWWGRGLQSVRPNASTTS